MNDWAVVYRLALAAGAAVWLAACAPAPPQPTATDTPGPPSPAATTTAIIVLRPRIETATPTPKPLPDPLWQQQGDMTLYRKDGHLCLLAGGQTPVYLANASNISYARLSPDGEVIAFVRTLAPEWGPGGPLGLTPFEIRAIDADGSHERLLLASENLAVSPLHPEKKEVGHVISQLEWVPGTHRLIVSTDQLIQDYTYALHSLDADTASHHVMLDTGHGGRFVISPDGRRIAVVTPGGIDLMNSDGTDWQPDVFNYEFLMTYSDSPGFVEPAWAPDSNGLRVAVPPHDPQGEDTTVRTWFIPTDGEPPYRLGSIDGLRISYFGAAAISPDGQYLVVNTFSLPGEDYVLRVMRTDGSADTLVYSGPVYFQGWGPGSRHFLFRTVEPPFDTYRGAVGDDFEPLIQAIPAEGCSPR